MLSGGGAVQGMVLSGGVLPITGSDIIIPVPPHRIDIMYLHQPGTFPKYVVLSVILQPTR